MQFLRNVHHRFQYQKIIQDLRKYPKSHLTSFLVWHEITAIVPIPIVYQLLQLQDVHIPINKEYIEEGNKRINGLLNFIGYKVSPDSKQFLDLVTSYVVVKLLLPVRIAGTLSLTPIGARWIQKLNPFK